MPSGLLLIYPLARLKLPVLAATGRPLCAPCAMPGITQKKYRERNLPGHNTGVLALLSAVRAGKFTVVPLFL